MSEIQERKYNPEIPERWISQLQDRIHEICPPLCPGCFNAPQPPHHVIAAMPESDRHRAWSRREIAHLNAILWHLTDGIEGTTEDWDRLQAGEPA